MNGKLAGTRLRKQIAEIDRKIKAQVIVGAQPQRPRGLAAQLLAGIGQKRGPAGLVLPE